MHVVVYEDRRQHLVGAQLAVATLLREVPGTSVTLRSPSAGEDVSSWCAARPQVELDTTVLGSRGWDVKPTVLLAELEQHEEVVWLDSDVVVWGDLARLLAQAGPTALVAAEETSLGQALGGDHRTRAWGLEVGASLPTTVNTGLLRVRREHRALLRAWRDLLADERYRRAQAAPWFERPLHLLGDQEVLTALLGSSDFCTTELHLLREGRDVAQCFGPAGWTASARVRSVVRGYPPVLVHAMGHRKPYASGAASAGPLGRARQAYERVHFRLGAYGAVAATCASEVTDPLPWARPAGGWRRACLREAPVALLDAGVRRVRRALGVARMTVRSTSIG